MAKKSVVVLLVLFFSLAGLCLAQFTVINGSFNTLSGWDGIAVGGRENGAFQGTVEYQVDLKGIKLFRDFRCNHERECGVRVAEGPHSWTYDWDKCPAFRTLTGHKA